MSQTKLDRIGAGGDASSSMNDSLAKLFCGEPSPRNDDTRIGDDWSKGATTRVVRDHVRVSRVALAAAAEAAPSAWLPATGAPATRRRRLARRPRACVGVHTA